MNCKGAHEQIVAAVWDELSGRELEALEEHLRGCGECRSERQATEALKTLADAFPAEEPNANLIARSRLRLDDALDALPPRGYLAQCAQWIRNGFAGLTKAPLAAALLLALGVGAGALGGYQTATHRARQAEARLAAQQAAEALKIRQTGVGEIASVSSIVRQPNSNMVEVHYNQLVPQQAQGSANDPTIQQLLMVASQNAPSSGLRDNSVELLAADCRSGHNCRSTGVRDALLVALRYDKNASVREKALRGLEPWVSEDQKVRNAVLEALLNDSDAHIRNAAINLLQPVDADTSVRQVLHTVADTDENPYIRTVSRQVLSQVPEIQ